MQRKRCLPLARPSSRINRPPGFALPRAPSPRSCTSGVGWAGGAADGQALGPGWRLTSRPARCFRGHSHSPRGSRCCVLSCGARTPTHMSSRLRPARWVAVGRRPSRSEPRAPRLWNGVASVTVRGERTPSTVGGQLRLGDTPLPHICPWTGTPGPRPCAEPASARATGLMDHKPPSPCCGGQSPRSPETETPRPDGVTGAPGPGRPGAVLVIRLPSPALPPTPGATKCSASPFTHSGPAGGWARPPCPQTAGHQGARAWGAELGEPRPGCSSDSPPRQKPPGWGRWLLPVRLPSH